MIESIKEVAIILIIASSPFIIGAASLLSVEYFHRLSLPDKATHLTGNCIASAHTINPGHNTRQIKRQA